MENEAMKVGMTDSAMETGLMIRMLRGKSDL
jgi:hypothetical protein